MEKTDLRTEFTKETKARFNVEWVAYNDYVEWLEQRLVKLLTTPPVSNSVCTCGSSNYGYGFAKCYDCGKIKDF